MSCCNITLPQGLNGWSPVLAVVVDGERNVLQITDWINGEGPKPGFIGYYLGPTGFVLAIEDATDIAGIDGTDGIDGIDGIDGVDGTDGADGADGAPGPGGAAIDHVSKTAGTGAPGTTDTYTMWGNFEETINLGFFTVYNGDDGVDGTNGTDGNDGAQGPVGPAVSPDDANYTATGLVVTPQGNVTAEYRKYGRVVTIYITYANPNAAPITSFASMAGFSIPAAYRPHKNINIPVGGGSVTEGYVVNILRLTTTGDIAAVTNVPAFHTVTDVITFIE